MPHPPPRMDPHCERERGRERGREGKGREGKGRQGKGREDKTDIIVSIFAVGGPFFDAEYYHTHDHLGYIGADPNATVAAQSMYVPPSMFNLPPPPPQHYQQVSEPQLLLPLPFSSPLLVPPSHLTSPSHPSLLLPFSSPLILPSHHLSPSHPPHSPSCPLIIPSCLPLPPHPPFSPPSSSLFALLLLPPSQNAPSKGSFAQNLLNSQASQEQLPSSTGATAASQGASSLPLTQGLSLSMTSASQPFSQELSQVCMYVGVGKACTLSHQG